MGIPDHLTCLLRNQYAGQKAAVRTRHGATDWFQIGKGVGHSCILSPCLFEWVSEVSQSCPTLCDPMDYSLPGSSVHGILQARILEWVAISFSRRSSQPRNRTQVSCNAHRCFTIWATREAYLTYLHSTSWEKLGRMKHKLESRMLGEISITSDMQMTPPFWQKVKKN